MYRTFKKSCLILLSAIIAAMLVLACAFMLAPKTTAHASTTTGVYWKLDGGVLTLRSDQIDSTYTNNAYSSWSDSASSIEQVVIETNIAPSSTSFWFIGCSNLTTITNLDYLDTSNVADMESMFRNCSSLTSLTLPDSFNTEKVTNMVAMFNRCSGLTSLTLPDSFNTEKVTNMSGMFNGCSSLTELNLPASFDTSLVTDMSGMFQGCSGLTSLDFTQFESFTTANVTDMGYMFYGCNGLTSLDLSSFNTSSVTNMKSMFQGCRSLISLDLSSFDTSKITVEANAQNMFSYASKLDTIITPATVGTVALPLPARFMYEDEGEDGKHTLITSISSEDANKTIIRHATCSGGGTATCAQKAVCSTCGNEYGDFGDHRFTAWAYDGTNHWHKCINCGESQGDEAAHSGTDDGDCTTAVTCSCGYEIKAAETAHDIITHGAKQPTCTEKGWEAYEGCSRCDYATDKVEIPATGHTLAHHETVAATEEKEGNSEYWSCDECDKYFSDEAGENEITDKTSVVISKLTPETPAPDNNGSDKTPSAPAEENKSYWWLFLLLIPIAIGVGGVTLGLYEYKKQKENNN